MHTFNERHTKAVAVITTTVIAGVVAAACTSTGSPNASNTSTSPASTPVQSGTSAKSSASVESTGAEGDSQSGYESRMKAFAEENASVSYDEERGIGFYNNRIVVMMTPGQESDINRIAAEYKASINEDTADIGIYALGLDSAYTYDELEAMASEIKESESVAEAFADVISEIGLDEMTGDTR